MNNSFCKDVVSPQTYASTQLSLHGLLHKTPFNFHMAPFSEQKFGFEVLTCTRNSFSQAVWQHKFLCLHQQIALNDSVLN